MGLAGLFAVAMAFFIPLFLVQMVLTGVSYPLLLLGSSGEFLRFVVTLPVCLVTGLLRVLYQIVYWILWGIYWFGTLLWGFNTWSSTSEEGGGAFYYMCPMFKS